MNKRTVLILLIGIIILGSFLRVYNLGVESFWLILQGDRIHDPKGIVKGYADTHYNFG